MATAIPAANIKVFPSANDVNSGSTGSGNIVTEQNMAALLSTLPTRNFIISGFDVTKTGDETVDITAGSAIIGGYYVQTDATISYTIGSIPPGIRAVYFYLTITLGGAPVEVTGAQFEDSQVADPFNPPTEGAYRVCLATGSTDVDGDLVGAVEQSKANYGGGAVQGYYVGTGDESSDVETLVLNLGFSPSFVYVAGTGAGGTMVACSSILPPTCKGSRHKFGGFESVGWCMVSGPSVSPMPKVTVTETAAWTGGTIATNSWGTPQNIAVPGVRPGDLVLIGGDTFIGTEVGGIAHGETEITTVVSIPGIVYDGGNIADGPVGGDIATDSLVVSGYVSAPDIVTWGLHNTDAGTITPNATATGKVTVISAWDSGSTAQTFVEGASALGEFIPYVTDTGFNVSRTVAGVADTGQTLNTAGQKYFYWAFS